MRKKTTSKKTTSSQGIGFIRDVSSLVDLAKDLGKIMLDGFIQSTDRTVQINHIKSKIDQLVGRNRANFTKTDVYQVLYLLVLGSYKDKANEEIKLTKANTIVAKLSTEGQYGNTGVVRRQTTLEKFGELFRRTMGGTTDEARLRNFANQIYNGSLNDTQKVALWGMIGPENVGARGRTGTRTERVSNRTRRSTTQSPARRITTPAIVTPTQQARQTSSSSDRTTSSTQLMDNIDSKINFIVTQLGVNGRPLSDVQKFRVIFYLYRLELLYDIAKLRSMRGEGVTQITNAQSNAYARVKFKLSTITDQTIKNQCLKLIVAIPYILCHFKVNDAKKVFKPYLRGYTKRELVVGTINALGYDGARTELSITNNLAKLMSGNYQTLRRLFYNDRGILSSRTGDITLPIYEYTSVFNLDVLKNIPLNVSYWVKIYTSEVMVETSSTPTRTTPQTSSVQVTDDNPRSTTPPEANQTASLIRDIPFTDTVGIEIEYYGVPPRVVEQAFKKHGLVARDTSYTHEVTEYWKIVPDVSVSGAYAGELVSPVLRGKRGLVDVVKGCKACADAGMLMDTSGGLHVHFGASGWSLQTIKNLIYNYHGFQDIIRKMLPDWRREKDKRGNTTEGYRWGKFYTQSEVNRIQDANNMQDVFRAVSSRGSGSGPSGEFILRDYRENGRYKSINVFCYLKYGTFEFRQYAGNIEADTVLNWIYFLHFLIEASKKKRLTNFTWKNVENILPKKVATFWANRIYELSDGRDKVVSDLNSRREL